jgi:hypothetical protein
MRLEPINTFASNTIRNPACILMLIVFIQKMFFVFTFKQLEKSPALVKYLDALQNHFIETLTYYHIKPIGHLLRDKTLLEFFGTENYQIAVLLSTLIFSAGSTFLIFRSLSILKTNVIINFIVSLLWGLSSSVFDTWRDGAHYDHINPFAISVFIFGIVIATSKKQFGPLALSLVFLGLIYSPAPLFLILSIVSISLLLIKEKKVQFTFLKYMSLPVIIFLLLNGKNYLEHRYFSLSTLAGVTRLQFTLLALKSSVKIDEHINQGLYPAWLKECFQDSKNFHSLVGPIYGICYAKPDDPLAFDFNARAKVVNEVFIRSILAEDAKNFGSKPWLFANQVPESSSKFSIEYGKVAAEVWKDLILNNFRTFKKLFIKTLFFYSIYEGSHFFYGLNYEPQHIRFGNTIIAFFMKWFLFVMTSSTLIPLLLFPYIIWKKRERIFTPLLWSAFILSICFWSNLIIQSAMICCENARMFISSVPLVITGGMASINCFYLFYKSRSE